MAENYMNYHDGSPYDESILLDQKFRSLMLGCHRERMKDDVINSNSYIIQSTPKHSFRSSSAEYCNTTPTREIKQEREKPIETQERNLQRRRTGSLLDIHALSYESNDATSSQSTIRMCEEYKQSMLPSYRNRLVQLEVRRLQRQAQRQLGTTSESVSSSPSSMNIQPSQVKLIKEDRRRKHMYVNNNCAAMKVGMTDIVTATSSLSSSKEVLEEERSQQLRKCLIRARFRIHTSRALLASHSMDSTDCQLQEIRTNSVSLNVSPSRNKPNNLSVPSTPSSKTTLLRGRYEDITPEQRYRKPSMVDSKFSATRPRSFGLSNYNDLEDKWAQDTGDLPSLSTRHNTSSPSHRCVNNSMTVMQDGSIRRIVNKGRSKSMKSEPVSPSVTRSFAFDPFPTSASSENTLWDNDVTWTAPSYTPGSLFPLFNEYQKDDETESYQLLVHEVRGIYEDDLCSKVTVNASNVVHPITKITVVTTNTTATTDSSSDVRSKSIKWNVFNMLSERCIPLICKQNSQDCSSSSNNEPRSLSTDQTSSRSSSSCDNPASPVNRGRLASVRKEKESSRRHRSRSSAISGNTDHQDQNFKKAATTVTRNLVTSCSKSKADNEEWLRSANASEKHVQPRSCSNSMEMVFYDVKQEDKSDSEHQQQQQ
jgi:hypothetical protein